jgi:hypothetical protein
MGSVFGGLRELPFPALKKLAAIQAVVKENAVIVRWIAPATR